MKSIVFRNLVLFILLVFISCHTLNSQTLTPTDPLNTARRLHLSEVLPNGNVLAFGGDNGDWFNLIGHASSEIYNTTTWAWSIGNSLNQERSYFTSVTLNDGSILAIGGEAVTTSTNLSSVEQYNPTTGLWIYKSNLLSTLYSHNAIKLMNGNVLVAAGLPINNSSQIYNPYLNQWSYSGSLSYSHGSGASMVLLNDGRLLLTGGNSSPNSAEIYNPLTGQWKLIGTPLLQPRKYHSSIVLNDGRVLIIGGNLSQSTCELFDPVSETFSPTGNLVEVKSDASVSKLADGKILAYGLNLNTMPVEIYDPALGTWISYFSSSLGAQEYTMSTLNNGSILISGGTIGTSGAITTTYLFDYPEDGTCSSINLASPLSMDTNICYGQNASIQVFSTQSGWQYQAMIGNQEVGVSVNGGGTIIISIPFEELALGNNLVKIKVSKPSCNSRVLIDQININTTITNTDLAQLSQLNDVSICNGDSIMLSSSNTSYSYLWSNGEQTQQISVNSEGNYSVQVRDASGCLSEPSDTISVNVLQNVSSFTHSIPTNVCVYDSAFQLSISPSEGNWSGDGIINNMFDPSIANIGNNNIIYEYCNLIDTFQIYVDSIPEIPAISPYYENNVNNAICSYSKLKVWIPSPSNDVCYTFLVNGIVEGTQCGGAGNIFFLTQDMYNPFTISILGSVNTGSCQKDTVLFSDSINIISPIISANIFAVNDTVCFGTYPVIGIAPSDTTMAYNLIYSPYSTQPIQGNGDTLYLTSGHFKNYEDLTTFYVDATNGLCNFNLTNSVNVFHKDYYSSFELANTTGVYMVNDAISLDTLYKKQSFIWDIDGTIYNGNAPSSVSFSNSGIKNITIEGTINAGCLDSNYFELQIFDTISRAPYNVCVVDTLEGEYYQYYAAQRTHAYYKDNASNSYLGGTYYKTTWPSSYSMFLKKFDANGNLLWEKLQLILSGDNNILSSVNGIDVDAYGNTYVAGNYSAKIFRMDSFTFAHNSTSNNGFLVKIDINGQIQWVIKSIANDNTRQRGFSDVKIDPLTGKIFASGHRLDNIEFTNGYVENCLAEIVVFEINSFGELIQSHCGGGLVFGGGYGLQASWTPDLSSGTSGCIISPKINFRNSEIILSGVYRGYINIGPFTLNETFGFTYTYPSSYAFIAILNPLTGWNKAFTAFQVDQPLGSASPYKTSKSPLLAIDNQGNFYMSVELNNQTGFIGPEGIHLNQFQFIPFPVLNNYVRGSIIVKYDSNGNYIWHSKTSEFSPTDIEYTNNQLMVYGFYGNYSSNPVLSVYDALSNNGSVKSLGYSDLALASFDTNGAINWMESIGSENIDVACLMEVKNCGKEIYLSGVSPQGKIYCINDSISIVRNQQLFQIKYSLDGNCVNNCFDCYEIVDGGAYFVNQVISICQGDSILVAGVYQNSTGIYIDSLQSITGCDSVLTTTLTVGSHYYVVDSLSICEGDSLLIGNSYQTTSGLYIDTVSTIHGCDSALQITLFVNQLPVVTLNSFAFDSICSNEVEILLPSGSPAGGNYNGTGVVAGNFNPTVAGIGTHDIIYTYSDSNLCINSDNTIITVISCIGINQVKTDYGISIYPNPNTGLFSIEKPLNLNKEVSVNLLDATSKLIIQKVMPIDKQKIDIDITNYSKGVYYLKLVIDNETFVQKILKN